MSKILIFALLITLSWTQGCPGFYGGDLLQSGKYALINPHTDSYNFEYAANVFIDIPQSGIDIAVTTATIGDYSPLNDWGYNFFIQAEANVQKKQVKFLITIRSDNSWSSIQLGYLFSGRTDLAVGNFEQTIGQFKTLSPGVYQASHHLLDQELPDITQGQYQIAAFISGFGVTDDVFDLSINQRWYTHQTRKIEIVFHSSSNQLLNIIFSYVIYPDVHPIFVFSYDSKPDADGSYHLSGPVSFNKDKKIEYDEWRIQNRFLDCSSSSCEKNCVLTEECIKTLGNVWQGRCIYCSPGVVFQKGVCTRKCGANQFYFNRVCLCPSGYQRIDNDCVKINECKPNQSKVNGECKCNAGYSLWQQSCRQCPSNSKSSADGSTCTCDIDYVFNSQDNTCDRRCDVSQNWLNDRCICKSGYISWKQSCRQCPSGSSPNSEKTTCVCSNNKVYFYDTNLCGDCPTGFIPNSDRSDCICPTGTKLTNGVCTKQCKANQKLVNGKCVPDCKINEEVINGKCQCIPGHIDLGGTCVNTCGINEVWGGDKCVCAQGHSKYNGVCRKCPGSTTTNADQTWCICQNANQIFNSGTSVCETCPTNSSPNAKGTQCVCNSGYSKGDSGACIKQSVCPPRSVWDQKTLTCVCSVTGENLIGGSCKACPANQGFNGKECVCKSGYFRIDGVCRTCDPRSTYNGKDCICNNGFYGNRDLCSSCHPSCGKCTGPEANQCTACSDITLVLKDGFCSSDGPCPIGSYLEGDTCKNCLSYCLDCDSETNCKKCAAGFEKIIIQFGGQKIIYCEEICGDGRRFQQACDDGNKKSGDGCSQTCETESGWTCVGGTTVKRDTCSEFIPSRTILESRGIVNLGGRVVQSVRASYLPGCMTENQCATCFKAIKVNVIQSLVPVSVVVNYVPQSKYQFFVQYKFDGLFVSSAFKVAIRLNQDFSSCFSADDFNQVLELTIDPSVYICKDQTYPLKFDDNGIPIIQISQECKKTYLS